MSLDIDLVCPTCHHSVAEANITYNLSPMWYAARPQDKRIIPIDRLTGDEALPILLDGIKRLKLEPEKYRAMNPENGWGDYDNFLATLVRLATASIEHPTYIWSCGR